MSEREKRLIDANELKDSFGFLRKMWSATEICGIIDAMPTADVTVQKWIPVSERLPKAYVHVLVCRQDIKSTDYSVTSDYVAILHGDNPTWVGDIASCKTKVTHWMPLPSPPKECE